MDHHISIAGPDVRARPENDEEDHRCEGRHEESDQNQGPARPRRGKLIDFLPFPLTRQSILGSRLIVVPTRRGEVRLFVPLRLGGSRLEFGYILCHTASYWFARWIRGGMVRIGNVITTTIKNTVSAPR